MKAFLFFLIAQGLQGVLWLPAYGRDAKPDKKPALTETRGDESHRAINLNDLPDRLTAYDGTISELQKEVALLKEQNAGLQKRLDHLEQQSH